jgi:hypothetical protein
MDGSTLVFHQKLIRLFKGCLSAYETWLGEQSEKTMVETLKAKRTTLTRERIETNGKDE